jgi:hypothetical protein
MKTEEKIAVMQAFIDGKKIELRHCHRTDWIDLKGFPGWNWEHWEYRIKAEPKVMWIIECEGDKVYAFNSEKDARRNMKTSSKYRVVKYIEVVDGQ